ncbi:ABC-2 type transport system ATP-binding protein [Lachnotalea glycerini]|uniref:ABC transporter ATP-binding protein n=1 Tax=Lachnotalea glycerini TaxID=1763509 RepID=A0A255IK00_9FIRM|nr:ABC transporter ATP-binding protein [Lachnotalea glycerini]PXV91591.1 ABC-2 type transport system ATP-binding protein [Lachnotalea glycerini]RDY30033.1 ABC transporter ATP-binding protein [Lachnotalea glycerini]
MNLLEVKGLYKSYSGFQLHDITFSLPKGYIMGYIGQNGAGKTTTINLITQLSNADKGEVRIDGMTYAQNPISYKEMIGYVGDEFYFPKEFKLKDIRLIMTKFFSTFQVDKFNQLVEEWKLPEKKKIAEYSRGMKVKLMFASVLSRDTKLLILDEATNGLDPVVRNDVLKILQAYIEDGEKSILFSTHILSDLEQIADYIIFINEGKMQFKASKEELIDQYLLIKGAENEINQSLRSKLIGKINGDFGFEAIISADDATEFGSRFVYEKPSIDQIVLHIIKNGEMTYAGN